MLCGWGLRIRKSSLGSAGAAIKARSLSPKTSTDSELTPMATWLLKTEPSTYSFADLQKEKRTRWDGVKNAAALIHLRRMAVGDQIFIYHSGSDKAVIGIARCFTADPKDGVIELECEK